MVNAFLKHREASLKSPVLARTFPRLFRKEGFSVSSSRASLNSLMASPKSPVFAYTRPRLLWVKGRELSISRAFL